MASLFLKCLLAIVKPMRGFQELDVVFFQETVFNVALYAVF